MNIMNIAEMMMDIEEMIKDTEITLITKKARKQFKVYVSWFDKKTNILCGWYTNKYGEPAIKQFDMKKYDFCL